MTSEAKVRKCMSLRISLKMASKWKRPKDVPFPCVWKRFEGKILENGRYNKYRIQDVTEDMHDSVLAFLVRYFLVSESICSSIGCVEDSTSVKEITKLWRESLKENMSVVALVENCEDENKNMKIAGLNILVVAEDNNEKEDLKMVGKASLKTFPLLEEMEKEGQVFQRHKNIKCFLKGVGLSVSPAFQKDNVGYELLKVRDDICDTMKIPLTVAVFTGGASQHLALKAGFTTVVDRKYGEFTCNGEVSFPRIAENRVKFMEKVYY